MAEDREEETVLIIKVKHLHTAERDAQLLRFVGRAMAHVFETFTMRVEGRGHEYSFDKYADDGHHKGNTESLVRVDAEGGEH